MKARVARRIVAGAESGVRNDSLNTLRKAAMMVGRPIILSLGSIGEMVYYPKGLKGEFSTAVKYRPWLNTIIKRPIDAKTHSKWNTIRDLKQKPGTITLDVYAGSDVYSAAAVAVKFARQLGARVVFDFNGILITARPHSVAQSLYQYYNDESDRRAEEYRKSPKYQAYLVERAEEIAVKQATLNALILELPDIILDEAKMMDWAYSFADNADDVDVQIDYAALAEVLETGGWVASAHVNNSVDEDEKKMTHLKLALDKTAFAQYIMGQVVSCLKSGMPPHPVTCCFVREYRNDPVEPDDDEDYDDEDYDAEEAA